MINNQFLRSFSVSRFHRKKKINLQSQALVQPWNITNVHRQKWKKLKAQTLQFLNVQPLFSLEKTRKSWVRRRYGQQLRIKQALKGFYGPLRERTFRKYLLKALNSQDPKNILLKLLESRLEIILYRTGFFKSVFSARQFLLHSHVSICKKGNHNFEIITRSSYQIKPGDIISFKTKGLDKSGIELPSYLIALEERNHFLMVDLPSTTNVVFPFRVYLEEVLNWGRRY